ncbi:MAG TPA: histidine phosphatase family protein [Kiloniellaceae bacterium]|nr:histidine phosphatase family protein [Kiloniellaceae bacterium]
MMRLFIVRHGESEWNAQRLLQGQADVGLSDRGRDQARALSATVQRFQPERVLVSDLARTRETAELLGYAEHESVPALREINVGRWTGQNIDDLMTENAQAFQGWRSGIYTPPGGESWQTFKQRTNGVVAGLRSGAVERALMVAHGGVIRALLEGLLGLSPGRVVPVSPASLTVLRLGPLNGSAEARLEAFNYRPDALAFDAPD